MACKSALKSRQSCPRMVVIAVYTCIGCLTLRLAFVQLSNSREFSRSFDSEKDEYGRPRLPDSVSQRRSRDRPIFQLFNDSCRIDHLGLPEYISAVCPKDVSHPCANLTCRNLLSGEQHIVTDFHNYTIDFMIKHPKRIISDAELANLSGNCAEFLRDRGYSRKDGMRYGKDEDFPIAYNVLVHRNAEQVERLIYALYRPQHQFCIHVDNKTESQGVLEALTGVARCVPNVFITSRLENVVYAGYSRLQADINCMKDHVASKKPWKYLINTAGEAFPLRSQREMIAILRLYNDTNDIEGFYNPDMRSRYEWEHLESAAAHGLVRTERMNPPPPHDIDVVKGSAYGAFTRRFVQFLLTDQKVRDLLEWFRTTSSPDEMFWATVNNRYGNPHLGAPGAYEGYPTQSNWLTVYAIWGRENCRGKLVRGICVASVADLPALARRPELFFNKLHVDFEPVALECLRAWVEHKDACPVEMDYEVYKQLPRVKERRWL